MRFFKKGTLHLEFKDRELWQEFNIRACAGKNWLPDHEMKAHRQQQQAAEKPERVPVKTLPAASVEGLPLFQCA